MGGGTQLAFDIIKPMIVNLIRPGLSNEPCMGKGMQYEKQPDTDI